MASSEICLSEYHGIKPWREEGSRKRINIQGSPALSSGVSFPTRRKAKITEGLLRRAKLLDKAQTQKGRLQRVEVRTGNWKEDEEIV